MKTKLKFIVVILSAVLLVSCSQGPGKNSELDIDLISEIFQKNAPSDFGYCDVSDYFKSDFISKYEGLVDCRVLKCNESTNFNEFGIFEFKNSQSARAAEDDLKRYLDECKRKFKNGIIYDVAEYPKFQNAVCKRFDQFLVYSILTREDSSRVLLELENISNK